MSRQPLKNPGGVLAVPLKSSIGEPCSQEFDQFAKGSRESPSDLEEGEEFDLDESEGDTLMGKFRFPASETGELLKFIWDTLGIKEKQSDLSLHYKLYAGLQPRIGRTFPVHQSMKDLILSVWAEPEKKLQFPPNLKRRFPFSPEDSAVWDHCPKLDAPLAKI